MFQVEDVEKEIEEKEKEQQEVSEVKPEETKDGEPEAPKDPKPEDLPAEQLELLQADVDDDDTNMCMKLLLDNFLQSLPNCVNRELIDKVR